MRLPLYRHEWLALAGALVAIAGLLGTLHHLRLPPVVALASAVSDAYYHFGPDAPSPEVVFVRVDHEAVKALGRWPWPRDHLAAGIARLKEARVVALDMVFSEPTEADRDQRLASALAETTAVGGYLLNGSQAHALSDTARQHLANAALTDRNGLDLIESTLAELSIDPILDGLTLQASLNTLPDPDERFRHYPAAFVLSGMVQPSLGVQTLQVYLNQAARLEGQERTGWLRFDTDAIALDRRGFTRLNFYPEDRFSTISFAELVSPDFDPARIRDRIVVLGITEAGVTDLRSTPLGQYPGPLMHATFLANLLDGKSLHEADNGGMALALLLAMGLATTALLLPNMGARLALYPLLAILAWLTGLGLYRSQGLWLETAYPMAGVFLAGIAIESALLAHSRRYTEKLQQAFTSYLPPGLVKTIAADPEKLRLGGEKKEITVLFSDIRGFTSMSEHVAPETLAEVMNAYFQPMTEVIFDEGGTLDKYIGDAIMALFNAPLDQADHALAACRAAIGMQRAQGRINTELAKRGLPPLRTGIGINTGPAIVGNLGSSIRFNYTAIGDAVNLASRLESATKKLGVDIALGESVYLQVRDRLPCRELGEIEIPGKQQRQPVYALDWQAVSE